MGGGGGSGGGVGLKGMGVRVDVIEELKFWGKFTKKNRGGGGVCWGGSVRGSQGGCEQRIEVFVKIQKKKKNAGGGGSGGRVGGGSGWM